MIDFRLDDEFGDDADDEAPLAARGAGGVAAPLYVALTRAVHRCYSSRGSYPTTVRQDDRGRERAEPAQLARRRRQRTRRRVVRRKAAPAAIDAAWDGARATSAPTSASPRCPPRPARRSPRRARAERLAALPPPTHRAGLADQQLQCASPARDRETAATITMGESRTRRRTPRRRLTSRRTTSCAFRAGQARAIACTRSSSASTSPTRRLEGRHRRGLDAHPQFLPGGRPTSNRRS